MDELSLWMESLAESTVHLKGEKSIPIASSSHEKLRITVGLRVKANGKMRPFVVIPRKQPVKEIELAKHERKCEELDSSVRSLWTPKKRSHEIWEFVFIPFFVSLDSVGPLPVTKRGNRYLLVLGINPLRSLNNWSDCLSSGLQFRVESDEGDLPTNAERKDTDNFFSSSKEWMAHWLKHYHSWSRHQSSRRNSRCFSMELSAWCWKTRPDHNLF